MPDALGITSEYSRNPRDYGVITTVISASKSLQCLLLLLPLLLQPPAFSYSFRNAEMNVRFFGGGQEGEEKEENSESDEEEGEQSSKCVSAFKDFTSAVFPNTYPLIWLALPFAVCAVLSAASFGNNTDTEEGGLVVFTRENQFNASTSDPDTQTTFVGNHIVNFAFLQCTQQAPVTDLFNTHMYVHIGATAARISYTVKYAYYD